MTATQTVTIQSQTFQIPAPFLEGHVLKANEASALNQLFAENIRNNFAGKMKAAKDAGQTVPGQAELDAYASAYTFGARAVVARNIDPVEKEARSLAWTAIKAALVKKGTKIKSITDEMQEDLITKALDRHPKYREQAKAVVEARRSAVSVDELDLG